jgi:hypothetical protein
MTHKLDADDLFIHRVQQRCAEKGLNFFLVEPLWVERFYELFARNEVWARVLLNMHSEHHLPEDIYHRLVLLAHHKAARVIDPPDVAQAAFDKGRMHEKLITAGLQAPFTVVVPQGQAGAFRLSEEQRARLGEPFVIKPSHGYGRRGVILDARSEADLARSVTAWPNPSYLLQKKIASVQIAGRPAYWRVFHVFGEVLICWWNPVTDNYAEVSEQDAALVPGDWLEEIVRKIAAITGMQFFSSEITQLADGTLMLIDYVNDQCHMLSQSANARMGVPDAVVKRVAARLVSVAERMIRNGGAAGAGNA